MKKIILMFVVLITSIANAQTFDFECEVAPPAQTITQELTTILDDRVNEPSSLLSAITNAANATQGDHGGGTYVNRQNFLKGFTYQSVTINFNGGNPSSADITDGSTTLTNAITDFGANNLALLTQPQFLNYTLGVVKKMWEILPSKQEVLDEIYALGVNGVNITLLSSDPDRFKVAGISSFETVQASGNVEYFSNEELDDLKDDIIAARSLVLPTGAQELNLLINEKSTVPFPDYDANNNHDYSNAVTTSTFGASPNLVSYILSITGGQDRINFILSLGTNANITGNNVVNAVQDCNVCTTYSRTDNDDTTYDTFQVYFSRWEYFTGYSGTNDITALPSYGWLRYAIDSIYARWYVTSDGATYNGRRARLDSYANAHATKNCGCAWRSEESFASNGSSQYNLEYEVGGFWYTSDQVTYTPVSTFQTGAISMEELTTSNWTNMLNTWKVKIDNAD